MRERNAVSNRILRITLMKWQPVHVLPWEVKEAYTLLYVENVGLSHPVKKSVNQPPSDDKLKFGIPQSKN
jgi:hypothetical protein